METELLWTIQREIKNPCLIAENDIFVSGSDTTIVFTDLSNGQDSYYRANDDKFGDGISCITGHKTLSIFAFAELCVKPKIFVLTYPEFVKISVLEDLTSSTNTIINSYINLTFSETEHLISLSGMPDYFIQIWSWRSATLLVSLQSQINVDIQLLRCSPLSPLTICQLSINTAAMNVWEVHGSFDMCRLINRRVKMRFTDKDGPFYCVFGIDGIINFMVGNGNVYQISTTAGMPKLIIEWSGETGINTPCITTYKGGLLLSGPDSTLKFFRRQSGIWNEIISVKPSSPINFMRYLNTKEVIIGVNINGSVIKIFPEQDIKIDIIKEWDRLIKFFSLINPLCEHIATINYNDELNILTIHDGNKISGLKIQKICSMTAHPILPVIAMSSEEGILYLISLYKIDEPNIITEFHICHNAILKTIYSKVGNIIVLHDKVGDFYVIKGVIGEDMRITHHIKIDDVIIDFMILENESNIYITGITIGQHELEYLSGRNATHINISLVDDNNVIITKITLPGSYIKISFITVDNIDEFYAIEFLSKSIHILKLENDPKYPYLICIDKISTIHQMKYIEMYIIDEYLITWGIDGITLIYDLNTKNLLNFCITHHRQTNGVHKARIDPLLKKYVVTIGHTGNLVCTLLKNSDVDDSKYLLMKQTLKGIQMKEMFKKKMKGFIPAKKGDRWIDIQKLLIKQKEMEIYKEFRESLLDKCCKLREKINNLLDKNEKAPIDEQLPIQAFNLDYMTAASVTEFARCEREIEEKTMRNFIISQNKITDWIKSTCWEAMMTKGTKIRGIFTKLNVDNYALINKNQRMDLELKKIYLARTSEYFVSKNDIFLPWTPQPTRNLEIILTQKPQIYEENNPFNNDINSLDLSDISDSNIIKLNLNKFALTGTSGHHFIKPIEMRYNQLEVVSFQQMIAENIMGYHQNLSLREFFNKKFDDLSENKNLEIQSVKKRNERLRYIQNELNILAKLKGSTEFSNREIIDPIFFPDEKPESIVTVEDWEIPVKPYISPSDQQILDSIAEEAERLRIAMLADDFHERALIKMMDGVLEIRWEDEIKKILPLPECVASEKDPKDYDQDDLREIQEYDDKMKCLYKERERYRILLEEEEKKLQNILDEQILKFNFKVGELLLLKMRVESAICQEDLKLLRNGFYNFHRLEYNRQENKFRSDMKRINQQIERYYESLKDLEQKASDCRTEYESLVAKDRLLDRQFKSNFADTVSRTIVDQVYKIFKRRPRWNMRAWATSSILLDLSKRIITKNSSTIGAPLPQECFDFLHLIDQLDSYSHAPNAIDEQLWQILCRMRRVKMESEFKLKGCGLQLAEAEATTNAFIKEINNRKMEVVSLENKLDDLRESKYHETINRTVQLVVKRGMVEIGLTGHISDFDGSVLLHIEDVDDINKIITKAGMQKLKTMQNGAIFRRKIISKEWEHQVLKLTVRDMKDSIKTINKCKITKEVQQWLKQYHKGWSKDLSQTALNREKEAAIKSCERLLKLNKQNVSDIITKIQEKIKENKVLDKKIDILNVNVTEQQMARDVVLEEREERFRKDRMFTLTERAKLVRLVQHQHAEIIELSTMLELQRLKTFPTLNLMKN